MPELPGPHIEPPPPAGPNPAEVRVTYAMTTSDILAGGVAASRSSIATNAIGAFALACGVLVWFITGTLGFFEFVAPVVFGAAFLSGYAAGGISAFMASRRPDLMRAQTDLTASAEGLVISTPTARSQVRWSMYKHVRDRGSTILLDLGMGAMSMLPSRVLSAEQRAQLLHWADAAGVLDLRPWWRSFAIGVVLGVVLAAAIPAAVVVMANLTGG